MFMSRVMFINFLFLLLYKHRSKYILISFILTFLVALLSSVIFISSSIKLEVLKTLGKQPDFIVQKIRGGRGVDIESNLSYKIEAIRGVADIEPRVFGRYYIANQDKSFMIVGVDFFDSKIDQSIDGLSLDINEFLKRDSMIVSDGVNRYLKSSHYRDYFNFKTPLGENKKVYIYKVLPNSSNLVGNDMVIVDIDLAREILGIDDKKVTDIALSVPNSAEKENVKFKLLLLEYDIRVISKDDIRALYNHLFNYKGGVFLSLFMISFITFLLILYQRYSMINSIEKREIGILRAVGWSVLDVIKLKVIEGLFISIFTFLLGVIVAYVYVFIFGAPILKSIFLGFNNIEIYPIFNPNIEFGMLFSLFMLFIIPFIVTILLPVWKIAIADPLESMK